MKSAKKILLLVLSLVLLVGIFTVATLADDSTATAATVVYPDGSTETVAVDSVITPKEFTTTDDGTKLYYGANNTLYKDDATEGWAFTVEGEDTALTDLTVTAEMAGKKIIASGADKVYYTSVEALESVTNTVYHLTDDVNTFFSSSNTGDKGDGTNTGASSYTVLRLATTKSITVTLYEDVNCTSFTANWYVSSNRITGRPCYLDLNGHNVVNNSTANTWEIKGVGFHIYSSKPGAHWYQPNTNTLAYLSDDAGVYLGDKESNGGNADNISFHTKQVCHAQYGSNGMHVYGGHYYQTANGPTTGLFSVLRRVQTIENASFYPLAGNSVFSDEAYTCSVPSNAASYNAISTGETSIKNCKFYCSDKTEILSSTNSAKLSFSGCTFYGATAAIRGTGTGTITAPTEATDTLAANVFEDAVTFKTATWLDGSTAHYYVTSLEAAQLFVESHPFSKVEITPHEVLTNDGKTMHYVYEPVSVIEYDAAFNAVRKDLGEQVKIYYTVKDNTGVNYHTTDNAHTYLTAANTEGKGGPTLTLYEDVDVTSFSLKTDSSGYIAKLDLNGHNVTVQQRSDVTYAKMYVYSSKPGAHYYAEQTNGIAFANDGGTIYLGDDGSGNYVDNIIFHTDVITCYNYGSGAHVIGGHYYQTSARTAFLDVSRRLYTLKNASFYVYPGTKAVLASDAEFAGSPAELNGVASGNPTIDNCKFYSQDGNTPVLFATSNAKPKFTNCEFYGVSATVDGATGSVTADETNTVNASAYTYNTVTWLDGTKEFYVAKDLDAAKIFVESSKKYVDPASATEPYGTLREDGYYYYIETPNVVFAYDGAYNAAYTDDTEGVRAYYTVEVNGETTYHTDAATAGTKLRAYLAAMDPGATITLWSDVSFDYVTVQCKQLKSSSADEATVEGAQFWLDINGYEMTITGGSASTQALRIKAAYMYIYSSRMGGEINAGNKIFFVSDNDEYNYTDPAGTSHNVKPNAHVYIGEKTSAATGKYKDNLTVTCGQINSDMYGSSAALLGGTYVQSVDSAASYFLLMSRLGGANHVLNVSNATFILSNPATSPLYYRSTSARTFTKCVFISPNQTGGVALSSWATPAVDATFSGCTFINVLPMYQPNGRTFTYLSCKYGTTSGLYSSANLNASTGAQYLAHSTTVSTITVNGVTYELDGQIITDPSTALLLTREDVGTDYWMVGTTPPVDAGDFAELTDGVLKLDPVYDYASQPTYFENGEVIAAGEVTILVAFSKEDIPAFVYTDLDTGLLYGVGMSECENATAVGDKFYELFNNPAAPYEIVLYTEMNLTKAMGFGPVIASSSGGYNRDYYDSLLKGAITLDLNGQTLTIDSTLVGINLSAANFKETTPGTQNAYKPAVFALECRAGRVFTLKSSASGAQIINNSTATLFGVGEGAYARFNIENADNNITVRTKGQLFSAIESYSAQSLDLNGGTYIYEGSDVIATVSQKVVLQNATFICTNDVAAIFRVDCYRANNLTATNCVFYSPNGAKILVKGYGESSSIASASASSPFVFDNCDFVNVTLTEKITVNYKVEGVATDFHAYITYVSPLVSTDADLALGFNGVDVSGLTVAYSNVTMEGKTYKMMSYYADGFAPVEWGFGLTENWLLGEEATHGGVIVDGVFGYTFGNVTVTTGENKSTIKLAAVKPGTMKMNLTLQSKIGMNLLLSEALAGATVTLNGETFVLSTMVAEGGYYVLATALAPNIADDAIEVTVSINGRVHTLTTGIGSYAKAVLAETEDAEIIKAQNLTYAMVEYVRAAAENASFLADVEAPAGYEAQTLTGADSGNKKDGLLSSIAFQLDDTIAIAISGTADAEGKEVNLVLATGRSERANITDGIVIFEGLYVNEFFGDMTLTVADDDYTYNYNLANYLKGIGGESAAVQALYNYAYYADAYVNAQ